MKNLSILVVLSLFTYQSCNKTENIERVSKENNLTAIKNSGWNIPNAKFATLGIGKAHNLGLEAFEKSGKIGALTTQKMEKIVKNHNPLAFAEAEKFFEKNLRTKNVSNLSHFCLLKVNELKQGALKLNFSRELLQKKGPLSDFDNAKNDVWNSMLTVDDIGNASNGNIDPMVATYNDLHSHINSNNSLSLEEKKVLVATVEVAFYSEVYWIEAASDPNSPWQEAVDNAVPGNFEDYFGRPEVEMPLNSPLASCKTKWWKWIVVAAADAAGALVFAPVNPLAAVGGAIIFSAWAGQEVAHY